MSNPYTRLRDRFRNFVDEIDKLPNTCVTAFWFSKSILDEPVNRNLRDIRERVETAVHLGFETIVEEADGKLQFVYRKKIPATPYVY